MTAPRSKRYPIVPVHVTVQRQPPQSDMVHKETHRIAVPLDSTVLHLLYALRAEFDSSFSFPAHFCKLGNCGVCALRVNGKTRLTCRVRVTGEDLEISPLPGRRVICDLLTEIGDADLG